MYDLVEWYAQAREEMLADPDSRQLMDLCDEVLPIVDYCDEVRRLTEPVVIITTSNGTGDG